MPQKLSDYCKERGITSVTMHFMGMPAITVEMPRVELWHWMEPLSAAAPNTTHDNQDTGTVASGTASQD